jgi:hypothetical protein
VRVIVIDKEGQVAFAQVKRGPAHGISMVFLGRPKLDLPRPTNSRLDCLRLLKARGAALPVGQTSLKPCFEHVLNEALAQETHP